MSKLYADISAKIKISKIILSPRQIQVPRCYSQCRCINTDVKKILKTLLKQCS